MRSLPRFWRAALYVTAACLGSGSLTAQERIPLFEDIFAGQVDVEFPDGMPNPTELHRNFVREPVALPWAEDSKRTIRSAIDSQTLGPTAKHSIDCRSSTCQVIVTVPLAALGDAQDANRRLHDAGFALVDALTARMGKDYSLTVAENGADGQVGMLIYFFDRR